MMLNGIATQLKMKMLHVSEMERREYASQYAKLTLFSHMTLLARRSLRAMVGSKRTSLELVPMRVPRIRCRFVI
jgi:hypothetical protein